MLTQRRPNRLSLLSAALVAGLVALPLAVAFAADPEQTEPARPRGPAIRRRTGRGAPRSRDQTRRARPWPMSACASPSPPRICGSSRPADRGFVRDGRDHKPHKLLEARSDAGGDYRLEIPGIAERTTVSIDAMKPGYRRLVGTLMSGGDPRDVEVAPGKAAEASLILRPALYFAGIVVDEHGKPIPGVKIWANAAFGTGCGRGREDREPFGWDVRAIQLSR